MNTKEKAEVMVSYLEGKEIEYRQAGMGLSWKPVTIEPLWAWREVEYRVKPPAPREFFVLVDGSNKVLGAGHPNTAISIPPGAKYNELQSIKVREVL